MERSELTSPMGFLIPGIALALITIAFTLVLA